MRVNPEKKEEKERVTGALLRSALDLAATHGFVSLGLREVARAADIAPTSFYRHFADMEELGLTLIDELAGPLLRGWVERAEGTTNGPLLFARIADAAVATASTDPALLRFVLAERVGAIASFRGALARHIAVLGAAVRAALERQAGPGRVPPAAADAAVLLLLECCARALDGDPERAPAAREDLSQQLALLVVGLGSPKGAP